MPSIITSAGEAAIAQKQAAEENLVISQLKFFNIDVGGDNPTTPEQDDVEPAAENLVHTAALTSAGYINPSSVVYSILLDAGVGDFDFTWIGWYTDDGILFAITHTTPQYKRRTTGEQTGNNFTRNLIFPFSGAQQLTGVDVPAATWQLDFTDRFETDETEERKANRIQFGRVAFMNDAFKVVPDTPNTEDACEATDGWTLSGGQGAIAVDAVEFNEGEGSLKISGQAEDATATKDISTAPRDWSGKNGLIIDLLGDSATNIIFFIEDSQLRRNKWNLVNQNIWSIHELKFASPDVDGNCDYSDVCKFGLEGLDTGVVYNLDVIKTIRFNDFVLSAGEAFLEGVRLEKDSSTYQGHLVDYNDVATAVDAIAPPEAGTRTDSVYLDVHVQGEFNTIAPYIKVVVSDEAQADYVDDDGYQHYVEKICEVERTTSEQIVSSMVSDFRQINELDSDLGAQGKIEILTPKWDHVLGSLSQVRVGGATGRWDYTAQNVKTKSGSVVPVADGDDILIVGSDSPTAKMEFDNDRLKIVVSRKSGASIPLGDRGAGEPWPIFVKGNDCLCDFWLDKTFDDLAGLASEEDQRMIKNQGYRNRIAVNGLQIFRGGLPLSYESPVPLSNPFFLLENGYSYEAVDRAGVNEDMCRFLDLWKFYRGFEDGEVAPIFNPFTSTLWEKVYLDDPAGRFLRIAKGVGATADNDPNIHDRTSPTGSETITAGNYISDGTNELKAISAVNIKKIRFGRIRGTGIPGPSGNTTLISRIVKNGADDFSIFLIDSETGAAVAVNASGNLTIDMGGNSGISLQDDQNKLHGHTLSLGDSSPSGIGFTNQTQTTSGGYPIVYVPTMTIYRTADGKKAAYGGTAGQHRLSGAAEGGEGRSKSTQTYKYILP